MLQEESHTARQEGLCQELYGEVADRRHHLPNIVIDHGREQVWQYDTLFTEKEGSEESYQHVGGGGRPGGRPEGKVNFTDIPDIVSDVRQIPVIIINNVTTTSTSSSDDEMEDYYENHKEWPASVR